LRTLGGAASRAQTLVCARLATPARSFKQNQTHGVKASVQNTSRSARRDAEGRRAGQHHGEVVAKARWGAAG
jgi:Tfp pilus assembly protein PilN